MSGPVTPAETAWWRRINAPLCAALAASFLCITIYGGHRSDWWTLRTLEEWESATIDTRFEFRGQRTPTDDRIVIVGIDDVTRANAPELVQTRRGWARLIDKLAAYRPRVIGIDAFFSSEEVNLSARTRDQVDQARIALEAALPAPPAATLPDAPAPTEPPPLPQARAALAALQAVFDEVSGDRALARSIERAGNVYLGVLFDLETETAFDTPPSYDHPGLRDARYDEAAPADLDKSRRPPTAASQAWASMESIATVAAGAGFVNIKLDADGHAREAYLVIEHGGTYYLPFALSVARGALGNSDGRAGYAAGERLVHFGERALPVGHRGEALLSFFGAHGKFRHISAHEVVQGELEEDVLRDKVVLVGYTDTANDRQLTPYDEQLPGVEIHATLLHNALHGELLRPVSTPAGVLVLALICLLLCAAQLGAVRRRYWLTAVSAVAVAVAYSIVAQMLFSRSGIVVDIVAPLATVGVVALATLSAALATEGREKARLRSAFTQYVPDQVVDQLLAEPSLARLGGVRRDLTVLFADIRGFSNLAEGLEPEVISRYLNRYFTPMTELILADGGMLDKYIGDALMAVYGAPLSLEDHASRACRSALGLLRAVDELNRTWPEGGEHPSLSLGIGVNSGPMSVGNMGSDRRFDYTVIGDAVNLGSRLEALTRDYGVSILVGEHTAELAGDRYVFREIDLVRVKGRQAPTRVFELCAEAGQSRFSEAELAAFGDALELYRQRDWDGAEPAFAAFLDAHPDDGPARVLLERVRELRTSPPAEDWDGVYRQRHK